MTTGTLTFIIIGIILAQIAIIVVIGFYRRKRQYQELLSPEDTSGVKNASSANNPAWEGFREFIVQRRVIEDGNSSICSFYLLPVDGQPLPAFRPGQFLTFKLLIKDPSTQQSKNVVRCYSLSDAPCPDYYRVSIKRVPVPSDKTDVPPGLSSNFFHDHVQVGNTLLVKAPSGHFHLMEDESLPIVLIGGGIGITPMLSIMNFILKQSISREVSLYYGIRNGEELIMKEHLRKLAAEHHNFHLHLCYSVPNNSDMKGVDYQHSSRVDIPLLKTTLKLKRYQFYICGPKPMMESLVPGLAEWGFDSGDIYYESFGPATLIKHKKVIQAAEPITITFSRSGKSMLWDPTSDSLLDFAEVNGIEVESGCRAGSCGSCQTAIKEGEVDYNQEPDADLVSGHCLLCIATPKGDITLDA